LDDTPVLCIYECSKFCFLFDDCGTCTQSGPCTWCANTQTCAQTGAVPNNCGVSFVGGNTCPCDTLTKDCAQCASNPDCGWCCNSTSPTGGGSCMSGSSAGALPPNVCNSWSYHNCVFNCSDSGCVNGKCACDKCQCAIGFGGPSCNATLGCDGTLNGPKIDICGVCGGNGTTCLGCNGQPFGPKYDNCGVCGGDGTSCFAQCNLDCNGCFHAEQCQWCPSQKKCMSKDTFHHSCTDTSSGNVAQCTKPLLTSKQILAVSLSAGIIAAIVIAAVIIAALIGFGGKKGYDYYMANKGNLHDGQVSPIYKDPGNKGTNPFYAKN